MRQIILLERVLDAVREVCSAATLAEDGGGLLGFHLEHEGELCVVVSRFVPGGESTVRRAGWFEQDEEHLNAEAEAELATTGARFQGNCHVHLGDPRPSWSDLEAALTARAAGFTVFALLIFSKKDVPEGELRAYLLSTDGERLEPVPLLALDRGSSNPRVVSAPIEPAADRVVVFDRALSEIERLESEGARSGRLYGRQLPGEDLVQVFSAQPTNELPSGVVGRWSSEGGGDALVGVSFRKREGEWVQATPSGPAALVPEVVSTGRDVVCARAQGLADLGALAGKHVAIVGAGSVGSEVALDLASLVGRITIVEKPGETLGVENLARHALDLADVGRKKGAALAARLRRANPHLRVEALELDARDDPDGALKVLEGVDLAVVSTDVVSRQVLYGDLGARAGAPVLFVWCYEFADAGEIFLQRPGGATYRAVFPERAASGREPLSERPFRYADVASPDELRASPGLRADIRNVVGTASAVALAVLDPGDAARAEVVSAGRSLWLVHAGRTPGRLRQIFERPFERMAVVVR